MFLDDVAPRGMGIWAPTPKKLNPASIKMAAAKLAAHTTTKGPRALGSMCRHITRQEDSPRASAARTYVSSLNVRNWPRTIRATSTHIVKPMARKTCQIPCRTPT